MTGAYITNVILASLLSVVAVFAVQLIETGRENQQLAMDLAELKDAKYGLLNADAWVQQVTVIVVKHVEGFKVTPENRKELKPVLEHALQTLVTQVDRHLREKNKRAGLKGRFKQSVQDAFMDSDELRGGIPQYADKILDELDKPKYKHKVAGLVTNFMQDAQKTSNAGLDRAPLQDIQRRYECKDRLACQAAVERQLAYGRIQEKWLARAIIGLTVILFVFVALRSGHSPQFRLGLLVLCTSVLMLCGILTPMMEIEARISELSFTLLDQPIVFKDQVLYFQSKSVLDVVDILMSSGKVDMILVGIMALTFSVTFPVLKLVASLLYLYQERFRQWRVVHFFAFKSAKWSMADVFVVAMLMAYIGFDGIISNQLSAFTKAGGESVQVLTTNGTSVQVGFFMFLAFCVANLIISAIMERKTAV